MVVKRITVFALSLVFVVSVFGLAACEPKKAGGEDALVGTWEMVGNPSKTVSVSKEGDQYFYTGSQGKMPATMVGENSLVVPMSGIEVTVAIDPATGQLNVGFMGESYMYNKAAAQ